MSTPASGGARRACGESVDHAPDSVWATMFDNLSNRLEGIVKRVRGKGRLTEADVDEMLREIRTALLEADVNVGVVREIVARLRVEAVGATRSGGARSRPADRQARQRRAGPRARRRHSSSPLRQSAADGDPMAGLQGFWQDHRLGQARPLVQGAGRNPLLVGAVLQRPAAVEQSHARPQIDVRCSPSPATRSTRQPVGCWRRGGSVVTC